MGCIYRFEMSRLQECTCYLQFACYVALSQNSGTIGEVQAQKKISFNTGSVWYSIDTPPNVGVQRRAGEIEIIVSAKPVSKMPAILWRNARPLQRDGRPAR